MLWFIQAFFIIIDFLLIEGLSPAAFWMVPSLDFILLILCIMIGKFNVTKGLAPLDGYNFWLGIFVVQLLVIYFIWVPSQL